MEIYLTQSQIEKLKENNNELALWGQRVLVNTPPEDTKEVYTIANLINMLPLEIFYKNKNYELNIYWEKILDGKVVNGYWFAGYRHYDVDSKTYLYLPHPFIKSKELSDVLCELICWLDQVGVGYMTI